MEKGWNGKGLQNKQEKGWNGKGNEIQKFNGKGLEWKRVAKKKQEKE